MKVGRRILKLQSERVGRELTDQDMALDKPTREMSPSSDEWAAPRTEMSAFYFLLDKLKLLRKNM